ncbi:GAF domain-containing protein [Clostridium sp. OS1-26]|uniref:GAF domain-containing protein n=1 Tax=Clostridium sp. OS1-26 TaxID=3070681 RepID=UPI0027E0318D|nr:GAF domain-containing protein [Clostridium sp. OS1-26]WML35910.1 GAF domain-containing protein [Clostridium sp. OS1-26]
MDELNSAIAEYKADEIKYKISRVNKLYEDLFSVCHVGDINYHRFKDGHLDPIHIMETDLMGIKRWKDTHRSMRGRLTIKGDPVLERIIKGETVYIYDVPNDPGSSPAFKAFGIKSLLIFPLFDKDNQTAVGLICIPSLDKHHEFTSFEIEECGNLVREFNKDINDD